MLGIMEKRLEYWYTVNNIDFYIDHGIENIIIEKRYLDSDHDKRLTYMYEYNKDLIDKNLIDEIRTDTINKYNFRKSTLYQVIISVNLFNKEGQPLVPINRFW